MTAGVASSASDDTPRAGGIGVDWMGRNKSREPDEFVRRGRGGGVFRGLRRRTGFVTVENGSSAGLLVGP